MNKSLTFVLGAATGAIAALFLSPNTGEKNRELVTEKIDHCTSSSAEMFQRAADGVRDKVQEAGEATKPTADDVRDKINEARDRIAAQVTRNRAVEDVEADVVDVAEDIAEDISADGAAPASA